MYSWLPTRLSQYFRPFRVPRGGTIGGVFIEEEEEEEEPFSAIGVAIGLPWRPHRTSAPLTPASFCDLRKAICFALSASNLLFRNFPFFSKKQLATRWLWNRVAIGSPS